MQARYYDPVIGRFYSNDPVDAQTFLKQGNVHGFNRYAYANNNTYKYTDPNGESPLAVLGGFIGAFTSVTTTLIKTEGNASFKQLAAAAISGGATGVLIGLTGGGSLVGSSVTSVARNILGGATKTGLAGASGDALGQTIAADGDVSQIDGTEVMISGAMSSTGGGMSSAAKIIGASDKLATVVGAAQEIIQTAVTKPALDASRAREEEQKD